MVKSQRNFKNHRNRGYAMLGLLAVVGITASIAVSGLGGTLARSQNVQSTATALAQAKHALISRAASDANHPGSLPCPDAVTNIAGSNVPNDGVADLLAGQNCPSLIGRLPWRTLGLPDLRDADGERLWYIVAPAYQDSSSKIINPATAGQINGYDCSGRSAGTSWPCDNPRALATAWVAVVFAPGKAFGAQTRDAAHAGNYAQFLESFNPADPLRLRVAADQAHNDRYAAIAAADIFAIAQRRVANELQAVLAQYFASTTAQGQSRLPWPAANCSSAVICNATTSTLPATVLRGYLPSDDVLLNQIMAAKNMTWFDHNQWRTTFSYLLDADCADGGNTARCGGAFTTLDRALTGDASTLVGAGNAGTRALLSFTNAGAADKTRLLIALK
jgi:type II secretory pathway pseudopilin PulG